MRHQHPTVVAGDEIASDLEVLLPGELVVVGVGGQAGKARLQGKYLDCYVVCNGDESEPGTFKDRQLMERDPHQMIEGMILASYAIGVRTAYIYIRGEFALGAKIVERALSEAYQAKYLGADILGSGFAVDIYLHRGAGAYICGEETALLESLEGKRGLPRTKPPFPATHGLFGMPTVVNNVETLANLPHIVNQGPEWFAALGSYQENPFFVPPDEFLDELHEHAVKTSEA